MTAGVGQPPGNHVGVHSEQAPVGVQQVLLVGDQRVSGLDVRNGLRRCSGSEQHCGQGGDHRHCRKIEGSRRFSHKRKSTTCLLLLSH